MNFNKSALVLFVFAFMILILLVPVVCGSVGENIGGNSDFSARGELIEPGRSDTGMKYLKIKIVEINGKEMVQLRELAEKYGWNLGFEAETKKISIRGNKEKIDLSIEKGMFATEKLPVIPVIREGRTYIPVDIVRMITEKMKEGQRYILMLSLNTDKKEYNQGEEITAYIKAINISEENIKLDFSSGQKYDLNIKQNEEEIWRWSEGRFFTMALDRVEIKPGKRLSYDIKIEEELEPGSYTLSGELSTIKSPIYLNKVNFDVK